MKRIFAHVVVLVNGSTADAIDTYQLGIFAVLNSTVIMLWRQKAYNTRFDIVINEYFRTFISTPLHIILLLIMDGGVWVVLGTQATTDSTQYSGMF